MRLKRCAVMLCVAMLAFPAVSGSAQERVINKIVIMGNERVSRDVVVNAIKSKAGQPYSQATIREDVLSLYQLGYFRDVQVDASETAEGLVLTYVVIEKPTVEEIVFSGNTEIPRDELEAVLEIKRGSVLDPARVDSSVREIKKLYTSKGYYGNQVAHEVEYTEENTAVIYLTIDEGVKGHIKEIRFTGNKAFSDRKLRSVMRTKEWNLFSWITKYGKLEMDILEVDRSRIRSFYMDHGYVTSQVSEPEITLSSDRKNIVVTFNVQEGDQFLLGSLDVTGDLLVEKDELLKGFKSRVGKVYRSSLIQKDVLWLTDHYADYGYANADISPITTLDREKKLVNVSFEVDKRNLVYFGRVEIRGNVKTNDNVIRRELKVAEGDLYSATALRKSRQRVRRTGLFKEVDLAVTPTESREVVGVDVRVEETETGALQFGAGYSSRYGVSGLVSLSQRNLFGRGYKARIKAEIGESVQNFNFDFNDPRVFDTEFSAGLGLYSEEYKYSTYDTRTTGGVLKVGRELSDTIRGDLSYVFEEVDISNVDANASRFIREQEGASTTGKVILTFTRNTVDNMFDPSAGSDVNISGSAAGLGGDNKFGKGILSASWFHPVAGDLVLNLRGKVGLVEGYGGKEVPLTEKFFIGGGRSVRGFEWGRAGPVDENDEPLGADKFVVFNSELIYPLSKALGLKVAVFYDAGKGLDEWSDLSPVRHAVGAGIRWYSPAGPIRIDWGYNLDPKGNEKQTVWDFGFGVLY